MEDIPYIGCNAQRASQGGLLIGEATIAAENGNGYLGAPGLYDDSQIAGWKLVTEAVHAKGGKIFLQLYHAGRQSNKDVQPAGGIPVGPSEVPHGGVAYTTEGWVPNTPNRALTIAEIEGLVESFRLAAIRGREAGFDGVELHAANGYLFDQFLQDGSNKRTDIYGGSFENRARFLMDAVKAFGRHFIANPDLPERFRNGWPLNDYDRPSFFGGTEAGYTDYPFHQEQALAA